MSHDPTEDAAEKNAGEHRVENPYAQHHAALPSSDDGVATVRPTGITVIAVVCIVAGMLGGLGAVGSLSQTLWGDRISSMFTPAGEVGELQREMQQAMMAVLGKYFIVNLVLGGMAIVLAVAFIAAGIGLIQGKQWSRTWARRTLLWAIGLETVRVAVYAMTQYELFPVTQEYMQKMAGGQGNGVDGETIAWISSIGVVIAMLFYVVWFLLKLILMIWARKYLAKPHLNGYFQTPSVT
ncbi:hypothetical protein Pla52o_57790 [Novipirellula galeiformis]|uniref:Uncharacterized protein n=1 Tax=Novipirellula galeiformis TaxID=2528004 RepID=A0A5C6BCX6_9BACT|nr:hypothetical protein [Novipirellula galeiformis]TWU10075.1 hypothetical protein Pla52o_57790 [Novipirellula galeiformis]